MKNVIVLLLLTISVFGFFGWLAYRQGEIAYKNQPTPTPVPFLTDERLMSVVNDWRQTQNFQPYQQNETLCTIASERLKQIKVYLSHANFESTVNQYLPTGYVAENLAQGYTQEDAEALLDNWLHSASHAANLRADYRYSCIKCDKGYCVQIFANF